LVSVQEILLFPLAERLKLKCAAIKVDVAYAEKSEKKVPWSFQMTAGFV